MTTQIEEAISEYIEMFLGTSAYYFDVPPELPPINLNNLTPAHLFYKD